MIIFHTDLSLHCTITIFKNKWYVIGLKKRD